MYTRSYPLARRDVVPSSDDMDTPAALAESFAYLSASEPRPPRTPPTSRLHSRYTEEPTTLTPPGARTRQTPRFVDVAPSHHDDYFDMPDEPRQPRSLGRQRARDPGGLQVGFSSPVDDREIHAVTPRRAHGGTTVGEDDGVDDFLDNLETTGRGGRGQPASWSDDELEEKGPVIPAPAVGEEHLIDNNNVAEEAQASQLEKQFFDACRNGSKRTIERLLAVRSHLVFATGRRLNTPLHVAAEHKHASVAQLLLENGANVDEVNQDGQTPLHLAAAVGSRALIRVLGNAGATIDARSKRNYTPLHMATSRGYVSAAMRLIDLGADVDAAAKGGIRPLHIAAFARDDVLVTHLLDRGASIDAVDDKRLDALNYAMMSQSSTVFHVIYSRILDRVKSLQHENEKLQRKAHEAKAQVHLIQDSKWLSKIPPLYTVLRLPSRRKSVAGILQLPRSKDKLLLMVHSQISGVCFHEPLELEISRDQWRELPDITIGGLYYLASLTSDASVIVSRGILVSVEQAVRRKLTREDQIRTIMDNLRAPIERCINGTATPQDAAAPATHPYQLKKLLAAYDRDFHWTRIPQMVRIKCAYHKKLRRLVWASDDEIQSHHLELFFHPPSGATAWMDPHHHSGVTTPSAYGYGGPAALRPSSTGSGSRQSSSFGGDDSEDIVPDDQEQPHGQLGKNPLLSVSLRLLHVQCRQPSDYNVAFCEWRLENRVSSMVHDAGRFRVRALLQQQSPGPSSSASVLPGGVIPVDALTWNELRECKLVFRVLRTIPTTGASELVKEFHIEAKYELAFDRSSGYRCALTKRLSCDALTATLVLEGKRRHYAGRRRAPSG